MTDGQYNRYKRIRDLSWSVLIKHNICELPVDVDKIARESDIILMDYDKADELLGTCGLKHIAAENDALSVYTNRWYILYHSGRNARFAIAHELGHILLRHQPKKAEVGFFTAYYFDFNREQYTALADEQEANDFAARLLAPACVLLAIGATDAASISVQCGLTETEAKKRAERLLKIAEKDRMFTSETEKAVHNGFKL